MNLVGPDVATIGNHEIDYGLAHLLFLEKCADFPIINANLHIKSNGRRMFQPFWIAHIDGMKILFIGWDVPGADPDNCEDIVQRRGGMELG